MTSKQRKTLQLIFKTPIPVTIKSQDIDLLMIALDGKILERAGSRVCYSIDNKLIVVHRPHPQKEFNKLTIKNIKKFLIEIGVTL